MDNFLPFSAEFSDGGFSTIITYFIELFSWIPSDLLLFIGIVIAVIVVLAIKRIFLT